MVKFGVMGKPPDDTSSSQERRRRGRWLMFAVPAAAIVTVTLAWNAPSVFGVRSTSSESAETAVPVATSEVIARGKVEPIDGERALAFDAVGVLRRLYVQEGDWVEAGQLLAELAHDDLAARVEAARHERGRALAQWTLLKNGPRVEDLDEARAELAALTAAADHDLKVLKTRRVLSTTRAVSGEELIDFQSKADEACQRRDAAAARLRRLEAGTRFEELDMARAALAAAEAKVRDAEAGLEKARLRAPLAGKVIRILLREGESVLAVEAAPVLLLADTRRLQVRAEIDETQILRVRPRQRVRLTARGLPDRSYRGHVVRILDRLGRKKVETGEPHEKVDLRVLEFVVSLEESDGLRLHQRVDVAVEPEAP